MPLLTAWQAYSVNLNTGLFAQDALGGRLVYFLNTVSDPNFQIIDSVLSLKSPYTNVNVPGAFTLPITVSQIGSPPPLLTSNFLLTVVFKGYCESNTNPCLNGGVCAYCNPATNASVCPILTYQCSCTCGFTGTRCDSTQPCVTAGGRTSEAGSTAGLSGGSLAAIAVGVIFCVVLVFLIVLLFTRNAKKTREALNLQITFAASDSAVNQAFVPPKQTNFTTGGFEPGVSNPMYDWYFPEMSRQESSDHLDGLAEGAFVVRDSAATPGWHMMVIKHENTVLHEKININTDGEYELLPSKSNHKQPAFQTVPDLVEYYRDSHADSPYILCGGGVSNPIYDNHHLGAYKYGEASPGYILADASAPQLPIKDSQRYQVGQLGAENEDMYTNAKDAVSALKSVAIKGVTSPTFSHTDVQDEANGYMQLGRF